MSETIWRATDKDGRCFQYLGEKPSWDGREFNTSPEDNALVRYHGPEKPPPGECWEMNVTRKGEQPSGGQVIAEREATIAELQAKLERPEMPEAVDRFLIVVGDIIKDWDVRGIDWKRWKEAETSVRAHYAQPFKFEVGGIYIREPYGHDELELLKILDDRMLFYLRSYSEVAWTDSKGQTNGWKIIKRVR